MLKEISVHLPNRPGQLNTVLESLTFADVNVWAFSIDQSGVYSIIRLICEPWKIAIKQLRRSAYSITEENVFAIPLSHEPGQLQPITKLLGENNVNIEYGYLSFQPATNKAIVFLKTNNDDLTKEILSSNGYQDLDDLSW